MLEVGNFYDALAPWYHRVYQDWEATIGRQGHALSSLLASERGLPPYRVLDAAVGIGTQALGLAAQGFRVTGSDISLAAVKRAGEEAGRRGLRLVTPCSETSHTPRRRHRPSALRVHCRSGGRWQLKWALITAAVD